MRGNSIVNCTGEVCLLNRQYFSLPWDNLKATQISSFLVVQLVYIRGWTMWLSFSCNQCSKMSGRFHIHFCLSRDFLFLIFALRLSCIHFLFMMSPILYINASTDSGCWLLMLFIFPIALYMILYSTHALYNIFQ